jgi:hypothetical protein
MVDPPLFLPSMYPGMLVSLDGALGSTCPTRKNVLSMRLGKVVHGKDNSDR